MSREFIIIKNGKRMYAVSLKYIDDSSNVIKYMFIEGDKICYSEDVFYEIEFYNEKYESHRQLKEIFKEELQKIIKILNLELKLIECITEDLGLLERNRGAKL